MVTTRRGRSLESATPELETPKRRTSALKRHGTSSTSAAQKPKTPFSSTTPATTTVFLEDWWLIKANGKDLGVGGFAARASLGVRAFSSAPVSKRHSGTVLETADGITVTICGLINMSRTHQNGFPSKVCSQFMLGFPYNWEECAASCLGKESTDLGAPVRTTTPDGSNSLSGKCRNDLLPSLNDHSVTTIRDLLLSMFGHSDYDLLIKNIYSDMLRTSWDNTLENSRAPIDSSMNSKKKSVSNGKSGLIDTAVRQKKARTESQSSHQLKKNVSVPRQSVFTRSMSRMQLRSKKI